MLSASGLGKPDNNVLFAFMAMPVFSQSKLLVGSWRLTAADKILPDGSQVADYGTDPRGIAIFTADGHYVVEIFRPCFLSQLG